MTWRLLVEGGGDNHALHKECREGFRKLLEKAGFTGSLPRIVACGAREKAYDAFLTAHYQRRPGELVVMLVDSEIRRLSGLTKWQQLKESDGWARPEDAGEEDLFLMVQMMEVWLLADVAAWEAYFGKGLQSSHLPSRPNLEDAPKDAVMEGIHKATRNTKPKGAYNKGGHSFRLLGLIDPEKLRVLPHARDFFETMERRLAPTV